MISPRLRLVLSSIGGILRNRCSTGATWRWTIGCSNTCPRGQTPRTDSHPRRWRGENSLEFPEGLGLDISWALVFGFHN